MIDSHNPDVVKVSERLYITFPNVATCKMNDGRGLPVRKQRQISTKYFNYKRFELSNVVISFR